MKKLMLSLCVALLTLVSSAQAAVYLNEVLVNPPGSYDDTREFIELQGTPGMKLDGYAVTLVNGEMVKYHLLGSVPPFPANQEMRLSLIALLEKQGRTAEARQAVAEGLALQPGQPELQRLKDRFY